MKHLHRTLALCLTLAALPAARAQSVSPVPAPTIITTAPYTINAAGYYQLGANLNYAGNGAANDAIITINANNVTLDFAGHFIAGPTNTPGTKVFGVYASERANLIIQNGTVSYCVVGLLLTSNGSTTTNFRNPRVLNMTVTKCYTAAMELDSPIAPVVSDCRISSIGGSTLASSSYGIVISGGSGAKVTNNTISAISGTGYAYGIWGPNSNLVAVGNEVSEISGSVGAYGLSSGAFAIDNTIRGATVGLASFAKYRGNLTSGCTTSFSGGTAVGNENN